MGAHSSAIAFRPLAAGTLVVSVTTGSAAVSLPASTTQYRLYNAGTGTAFFNFGSSSAITASVTTGTPMGEGAYEVFSAPPNATHIATISSGTPTLYVTAGEGV